MPDSTSDHPFIFTASGTEAYQHYIDTIENGFSLESVSSFLPSSDFNNLNKIYASKSVRAWGALPGKGNLKTWNKMRVGDPILIYRNKNFEYYAFVSYKARNRELAEHLWGLNSKFQTWEFMYFLDGLTEVSVPVAVFNTMLGYERHYTPQGFNNINEEKISDLTSRFSSIDNFLNYLAEGKWVEKDNHYPREVRKEAA